jgi:hypothetical protein
MSLQEAKSDRNASLTTIAQILDYAILEATDLSLPMLVYLLRVARMEVDECAEGQVVVSDTSE